MSVNLFVLVTGYSGAGKSTTIAFLQEHLNAHVIKGDEAVSDVVQANGYRDSLDYLEIVGVAAFTAAASHRLIEVINSQPHANIIIDGVYDPRLAALLREQFPQATVRLIHLSAPWEVRLERLQERFGWTLTYTEERLKLIDDLKRQAGVEQMAEIADARIVNAGQNPAMLIDEVKRQVLPLLGG